MPDGPRVDGSKVRFWATKAQAIAAAKAIRWPVSSVAPIHTRFCCGWALAHTFDLGDGGYLSREEFGELWARWNSGEVAQ